MKSPKPRVPRNKINTKIEGAKCAKTEGAKVRQNQGYKKAEA